MILKRVSESIFFQIKEFTASLNIKKRWQILWSGIQATEDYPSILREEALLKLKLQTKKIFD